MKYQVLFGFLKQGQKLKMLSAENFGWRFKAYYEIYETSLSWCEYNFLNSTAKMNKSMSRCLIPLFHTGPESPELTRIDKYLDL